MIQLLLIALAICRVSLAEATAFSEFDQSGLKKSSFFEQFQYSNLKESGWVPSTATTFDAGRGKHVQYDGKWAIESSSVNPGFDGDKGLALKSRARHHAISHKLAEPFNNTNRDLVLQYEIKLQRGLSCGGTYIKLLDLQEDYSGFNSESPYQIMFGPDKCGSNDKVHFIIRRENPLNGQIQEKHLASSPMSRGNKLSNLYTLILKKNQDFEIRINGEVAKAGNLINTPHVLEPPLTPPMEVADENDTQPSDWDDREYIVDPEAKEKPDDYDIKHGLTQIPDLNAVKPEDWDESLPLFIEDPKSSKPEGWDDLEDGRWIPAEIRNPACAELSGCGKWSPPLIVNADYIGPWIAPKIPNPNYMGKWSPRNIPNPAYFEDKYPSNLNSLVGAIAFELWSIEADILFDNIYLGHYVKEAELIGNSTWKPKNDLEYKYSVVHKEPVKNAPKAPPPSFDELVLGNSSSNFMQFVTFLKLLVLKYYLQVSDFYFEFITDPVITISEHPIKFFVYCMLFATIITSVLASWALGAFIILNWSSLQPDEEPVIEKEVPRFEELGEEPLPSQEDEELSSEQELRRRREKKEREERRQRRSKIVKDE